MIRLRLKQLRWWRRQHQRGLKKPVDEGEKCASGNRITTDTFCCKLSRGKFNWKRLHQKVFLAFSVFASVQFCHRVVVVVINWPALSGTSTATPTPGSALLLLSSENEFRKMHAQVQRIHLHSNCIVSLARQGDSYANGITRDIAVTSGEGWRWRHRRTSPENSFKPSGNFFTRFSRIALLERGKNLSQR